MVLHVNTILFGLRVDCLPPAETQLYCHSDEQSLVVLLLNVYIFAGTKLLAKCGNYHLLLIHVFWGPLNGQLHILDQIVKHFIRFYNLLVSSDNSIVSFIARVSMSNRMSYLRSNILYVKWKYDVDITTTNIQQCTKCVYDTGQENAQILSYVNMIQELIAAHDGFKIIQNLYV